MTDATGVESEVGREFEVVVYGATGFTGSLAAEHLAKTHGHNLKWAIAGRSADKLDKVAERIGAPDVARIIADASDPASLAAMAKRAKVVLTTVGPYNRYGEPLVKACAEAGTDYVDLTGELAWMRRMIDAYRETARRTGARIVFSCGFDSIPFDIGVLTLQQAAKAAYGAPLTHVRGRVTKLKGGASGGTVASMFDVMSEAGRDAKARKLMMDPFALTDTRAGPPQPSLAAITYDKDEKSWAAPFIMSGHNTRIVHWSNALMGHAYGDNFVYDEALATGGGIGGALTAQGVRAGLGTFVALAASPARGLLGMTLPKPGQGPSEKTRETGYYRVDFFGETDDGRAARGHMTGNRDPGYGSTSKMIAESALCLARDVTRQQTPGGIWSTAAAMGEALRKRLEAHAGLHFEAAAVGAAAAA